MPSDKQLLEGFSAEAAASRAVDVVERRDVVSSGARREPPAALANRDGQLEVPPRLLTPDEVRDFAFYGCVLLEDAFAPAEVAQLARWADEVAALPQEDAAAEATFSFERDPEAMRRRLREAEAADATPAPTSALAADADAAPAPPSACPVPLRLCRVESFISQHAGLRTLAEQRLAPLAAQLLGEPRAFLFKEKLNIKHASGGGGYAPHFDGPSAAAAGLAQRFVTVQLAVDAQTVENGCLHVVMPRYACPDEAELEALGVLLLPTGADPDADGRVGAISPAAAAAMEWQALPCAAGSLLLFHGLLPHRSPPNCSDAARRTFYFIFNGENEGDQHAAYVQHMRGARARFRELSAVGSRRFPFER